MRELKFNIKQGGRALADGYRDKLIAEGHDGVILKNEAGETVEDLGAEAGVTENTVRRWCKLSGITPPRILEQISLVEQREIRELLEEQVWQDIAQAYNVSRDAIEELKEPAHRQLDTETLSYLFELLGEEPAATAKKLCGIAKEAGLDIPENAVSSYRKRLKSLNII